MAFGQQSGPPATAKQVAQLLALLQEAGHSDFRDARGPLGFTQRQAAGKFTRDEADALIEALEAEAEAEPEKTAVSAVAPAGRGPERPAVAQRNHPAASNTTLRRISTPELAAELQRRGWIVVEP